MIEPLASSGFVFALFLGGPRVQHVHYAVCVFALSHLFPVL
jgi:hypothetical protein